MASFMDFQCPRVVMKTNRDNLKPLTNISDPLECRFITVALVREGQVS